VQDGAVAFEEIIAGAGQFDAAFHINHIQRLAQLHVVFRFEIEGADFPAFVQLDVFSVIQSEWDFR